MQRFTRIITLSIIAIIVALLNPAVALAGTGTPFNKIIFFGDSLSDNGNLYYDDYGYLPKSPPYFQGRFSNGYVWSELVAERFKQSNNVQSTNYAVGGETARLHNPYYGYLPYSLIASVDNYLVHTFYRDRSTTLFVILIGANDYLNGVDNADTMTNDVVSSIKYAIETLIYRGGTNFLLINLPDLSQTPRAKTYGWSEQLKAVTLAHNLKLANIVDEINNSYKSVNIEMYDANKFFNALFTATADFNKQNNTHLTNTTSSCWMGGYFLRANAAIANSNSSNNDTTAIEQKIESQMLMKIKSPSTTTSMLTLTQPKSIDAKGFAKFAASNPDLRAAFDATEAEESGKKPCASPDNYVFWDTIHPTAVIHRVLSEEMIKFINQNYQVAQ